MQVGGTGTGPDFKAYLEQLLAAPAFANSRRRAQLLRYLVERKLAAGEAHITEYAIGVDVFQKPESFDPRIEATVRVEMSRLRRSLAEYYANGGSADPWRIQFPNRGYVPEISAGAGTAAAPVPAARQQTATWMFALTALVAGLALLIAWSPWRQPLIRSVVVLPFKNLTGNPQTDYLSDGITEQLTDALAQVPTLRVVARTSAFQFKNRDIDIRQIGRQVNADAVIEGSLRDWNGQFRLTVQVNRSADGYHIVSRTFDGGMAQLARMESDMVLPVLGAIRPGAAVARHEPADPVAYDLFLKARAQRGEGTLASFDQAIIYLNQAIARDPKYADAFAALAGVYASGAANFAHEPLEYAAKAKAAAARALELDPYNAPAHAALGFVDGVTLMDWKRSEAELRDSIRLMPGSAAFHNWLGVTLIYQGRIAEALPELRRAESLDPLTGAGVAVGLALEMGRRYDEALQQLMRVLALHPQLYAVHPFIGSVWEEKGEYAKAMAEYRLLLPTEPDEVRARIAHLLAVSGQPDAARRMLASLEHPGPGQLPPNAFDVALVHAALGEKDAAFAWLERGYRQKSISAIKVHPMLDPLRGDPRYQALLAKCGLQ